MHFPTLFVSDIHLGTSVSNPEPLIDFLKENSFDKIYLVGDIIDVLAIKRKIKWKPSHNLLIQKLLRLSRKGTKIYYIIGNHDEALEEFVGESIGNIPFLTEITHTTKDNKKLLVTHGHQFDAAIKSMKFLYWLGDYAYHFLLKVNKITNFFAKPFTKNFSLSFYLKKKVKNIVSKITDYEKLWMQKCKEEGYDGIVCGHIHIADIQTIDDIQYYNCGCMTEYCSLIVEQNDGQLKLIKL